ncbi:hypothetical protein Gpo141_00007466 [Globisporangium polare]
MSKRTLLITGMLLLLAVTLSSSSAVNQLTIGRPRLSIPCENDTSRAVGASLISQMIKNERREIVLGNVPYPDFDGPVLYSNQSSAGDESLYASMLPYRNALLLFTENPKPREMHDTMAELIPFDSHSDSAFHMAYLALEGKNLTASPPKALLTSDESFGAWRLGIVGHNLQLLPLGVPSPLDLWQLTDELVQDVCDEANITTAVTNKRVFVAAFSMIGEFTDDSRARKINATGFVAPIVKFHQAMQTLEEREDAEGNSERMNSFARPSQVPIFPSASF